MNTPNKNGDIYSDWEWLHELANQGLWVFCPTDHTNKLPANHKIKFVPWPEPNLFISII